MVLHIARYLPPVELREIPEEPQRHVGVPGALLLDEDDEAAFDIEADGGIKVENSEQIIDAGADILVAGTAILASKDYSETIKNLR